MPNYRMQLYVSMMEVESFDTEDEAEAAIADPLKRDQQEIDFATQFKRAAKEMRKVLPGAQPDSLPGSAVSILQNYDVPAESLEKAAALLKSFERLAQDIGVRSKTELQLPRVAILGPFVREK